MKNPPLDDDGLCIWCMSQPTECYCPEKKEAPDVLTVQGPWQAKYDGQCPDCNLPIREGEWIARRGEERVRHWDCM